MIFWNVKSYSCIYLKWVHSVNVAKEALDRNSWIFDADHWFSSKSRENMIFSNVKSYSCIYLKWILFQKHDYIGIRQTQLNFRCRSLFQFKVTWKYDFCQKLFLSLFEMNSLQKHGYRTIRQKQLNFSCRSLVQFNVTWKYDFLKCQKLFLYVI